MLLHVVNVGRAVVVLMVYFGLHTLVIGVLRAATDILLLLVVAVVVVLGVVVVVVVVVVVSRQRIGGTFTSELALWHCYHTVRRP